MAGQLDSYASARTIGTQLFERCEFDLSREIEGAIAAGSSATEILMNVRFAFQGLLRSSIATDYEVVAVQTLVVELVGELGSALRPLVSSSRPPVQPWVVHRPDRHD